MFDIYKKISLFVFLAFFSGKLQASPCEKGDVRCSKADTAKGGENSKSSGDDKKTASPPAGDSSPDTDDSVLGGSPPEWVQPE